MGAAGAGAGMGMGMGMQGSGGPGPGPGPMYGGNGPYGPAQGFQPSYLGPYGPSYGPGPFPGYTPNAPGGPAANSAQILGTTDVHMFDDNNENARNPYYKAMRDKARSEGDKMANCFSKSQESYKHGDGSLAKDLSMEGEQHKKNMEQLNTQAAEWIFAANNADSPPDTIDLHGLYVKEALAKVQEAVPRAQRQHFPRLRLIVGKGIHSQNHVAHLKPAVQDLLQKHNVTAFVDPHNQGVVIVQLQNPQNINPVAATRELARGATGNEQECVVM